MYILKTGELRSVLWYGKEKTWRPPAHVGVSANMGMILCKADVFYNSCMFVDKNNFSLKMREDKTSNQIS
jgi:hypothetical protein